MSSAAVSFAVNDRPGVAAETRTRILAAAADLGWEPSAHARALTDARARAVGLVLARDPAALETDAFFARFVAGLERTLAPQDLALLLQLTPEPDPRAYARLAAAGRVDGFVLTDVARDDPRFAVIEAAGVPAVVAGHPGPECPFPWLETAHGEGMAAAARHLAARGHERIGFLGGPAGLDYVRSGSSTGARRCSTPGWSPGRSCAAARPRPAARRRRHRRRRHERRAGPLAPRGGGRRGPRARRDRLRRLRRSPCTTCRR